jgi:DNA-binding transcriptional LysR family regulator
LRFSYGARDQIWTFRRDGEATVVPVNGHVRSNNSEVLLELALADGGIALLPDWLVDHDIGAGRLTALFDTWEINPDLSSSAISALYLPNQRGSKRIAAFLDFLGTLPGPTRQED